jgi:transcriptional regulator with XRE-family HTH domain
MVDYLALGARIRDIRQRKGLSLEELATKANLSSESLQAIESDRQQPIIGELIQIAKALQVNVADIFRDRPQSKPFEIVRSTDRSRIMPLRQAHETKIWDYQYESLTLPSESKHLEAFLIFVPPKQKKPSRTDLTHPGEEFVYLLEGQLHGEISGESFELEVGDSLYLRSDQAHVFYNPGESWAKALTVIYPF